MRATTWVAWAAVLSGCVGVKASWRVAGLRGRDKPFGFGGYVQGGWAEQWKDDKYAGGLGDISWGRNEIVVSGGPGLLVAPNVGTMPYALFNIGLVAGNDLQLQMGPCAGVFVVAFQSQVCGNWLTSNAVDLDLRAGISLPGLILLSSAPSDYEGD